MYILHILKLSYNLMLLYALQNELTLGFKAAVFNPGLIDSEY